MKQILRFLLNFLGVVSLTIAILTPCGISGADLRPYRWFVFFAWVALAVVFTIYRVPSRVCRAIGTFLAPLFAFLGRERHLPTPKFLVRFGAWIFRPRVLIPLFVAGIVLAVYTLPLLVCVFLGGDAAAQMLRSYRYSLSLPNGSSTRPIPLPPIRETAPVRAFWFGLFGVGDGRDYRQELFHSEGLSVQDGRLRMDIYNATEYFVAYVDVDVSVTVSSDTSKRTYRLYPPKPPAKPLATTTFLNTDADDFIRKIKSDTNWAFLSFTPNAYKE